MARLKCKKCEVLFELTSEDIVDCPNCGNKLSNSYIEWKKKEGNQARSFDDYKRKKCYPSSRHKPTETPSIDLNGKLITDYSDKKYSNPYKKLQKSNKDKAKFVRRLYLYISIMVLFLILLFTNPGYDSHKTAFHQKIEKSTIGYNVTLPNNVALSNEKKEEVHETIIHAIESNLIVEDYLIMSVTKVYYEGRSYPVGFGILGVVLISDNISKLTLNKPM